MKALVQSYSALLLAVWLTALLWAGPAFSQNIYDCPALVGSPALNGNGDPEGHDGNCSTSPSYQPALSGYAAVCTGDTSEYSWNGCNGAIWRQNPAPTDLVWVDTDEAVPYSQVSGTPPPDPDPPPLSPWEQYLADNQGCSRAFVVNAMFNGYDPNFSSNAYPDVPCMIEPIVNKIEVVLLPPSRMLIRIQEPGQWGGCFVVDLATTTAAQGTWLTVADANLFPLSAAQRNECFGNVYP